MKIPLPFPRLLRSLLFSLLLSSSTAEAQPLPVLTVPAAKVAPRMDASLDAPAWQSAAKIQALTSSIIPNGKTPSVPPTQVLALWDKDFLYLRFIATDNEIYTPFTERDALHYLGDVVEVFLDVAGDGRQYYEFELSARGGVLDQTIVLSTEPRTDEYGCLLPEIRERDFWPNLAWNCEGLRTATQILHNAGHDTGWLADYALPAKTVLQRLGQTNFSPGTIRANFLRYDWPLGATTENKDPLALNWSPVLFGSPQKSAARMGFLRLIAVN